MEHTVNEVGPLRRQLSVTVSAAEVAERRRSLLARYASQVRMNGFRPGRTPAGVVEKRYGKAVTAEAHEALLSEAMEAGMQASGLRPLGPIDVDEHSEDDGLRHVVSFDIRPDIHLPEARDLSVTPHDTAVTDAELEQELTSLRRRYGSYRALEADETLAAEDMITLSGTIDHGEERVREVHDLQHLIGGYPLFGLEPAAVVERFASATVGAQVTLETTLPADFTPESWAGKAANITVTVQAAKRMEPAALAEDFFQRLGASDEASLREMVSNVLQERKIQAAREAQGEELVLALVERCPFDLPQRLLERVVEGELASAKAQAGDDAEVDEAAARELASEQLRRFLLVEAVATQLGVKASRQEIEQHIAYSAYRSGLKPDQLAKQLANSGQLHEMAADIRNDKAVNLLLDQVLAAQTPPTATEAPLVVAPPLGLAPTQPTADTGIEQAAETSEAEQPAADTDQPAETADDQSPAT